MKQPELGIKIGEIRNQRSITQKELSESCNIDIRMHQIDFICPYISSVWVACLKAFLNVSFEINSLQNIQRLNRTPNKEVITSGAPGTKEYWNSTRSLIW